MIQNDKEKKFKTVLVVDDDGINIKTIGDILSPYYKVRAANSADNALKVLKKFDDVELIILDVIMPFVTGYDFINELKQKTENKKYSDIPVIFISELNDIVDEYRAFKLGAIDYIKKPIAPSILLSRVETHIALNTHIKELKNEKLNLLKKNNKDSEQTDKFKDAIIFAISKLARSEESDIQYQNIKTQKYVKLIALDLFDNNIYPFDLKSKDDVQRITNAVPLYDIGMIGIHDSVSLKNGKYTLEEFSTIQKHTTLGYEALEEAIEYFDIKKNEMDYMSVAIELAHYHHEHWDGTGYPEGLENFEIPLSARIMAVADVFNALISERNYNRTFSLNEAKKIILDEKGKQFDPKVVDAFVRCFNKIKKVADGDI